MAKNFPAGSTWRKWDLHVHTPASIVHNYQGKTDEAWEQFFADLEALPPEFKVIGINDYIFVDGYERVLKAKRDDGRLKNIDLILPVLELRLDKFAGIVKKGEDGKHSKSDWNRINLHIIFDELEPEVIRQQFLSGLVQCYHLIPDAEHLRTKWQAVITPASLAKLGEMIIDAAPVGERKHYASPTIEGFNNLCCSLDRVIETLQKHDLQNRYLLAVGKTEWDNMKWNDQSIAEKRNVVNRVDLVFTAADNPRAYDQARKKLIDAGVNNRLLDCSDAHALSASQNKDRVGNSFTWIKADPTFAGLCHAVTEFEGRVFIGDKPPKTLLVSNSRRKFASTMSVQKANSSQLADTWFDVKLPLNHDLVAIIGNKGSGKSALADILALVGDTKNHGSFSFLTQRRFRDPRSKLSSNFIGAIGWADETVSEKTLNENPTAESVERIKYLPQSYLESLCNELASSGSSTFDAELRKIIYTHVPAEQQIGFSSLDELLKFKVSELTDERERLVGTVRKINAEIASIERKLAPSFRSSIEQQLSAKRGELEALAGAKPVPVDDPKDSDAARAEAARTTTRLQELDVTLRGVALAEKEARNKKGDLLKRGAHAVRAQQALKNYQKLHNQFVDELAAMIRDAGATFPATELVELSVDYAPVEGLVAQLRAEAEACDALLTDTSALGLMGRRQSAEVEANEIKGKLGEDERLFLVFKEQFAQWERLKIEIEGDAATANTIAWFEAELAALALLPARREELRSARRLAVRKIHDQISSIVTEYKSVYKPVQEFVQSAARMDMPLPLSFNVRIVEEGFQEDLLSRINRQARGSFSGVEESSALVRNLLQEVDFMDAEATVAFVDKFDDMLHFDRRPSVPASTTELAVFDQLRKGGKLELLYDYLFGLEYLQPQYSLTYNNQEISQLSPGERGLLLLVFYLLVDKDDIPLVIDQPEENLDNQTIFKILVTCIKVAKARRQVILVTHNPNLAVVCDAEQIIYASCDKANNVLSYESGGLESPQMKERVVEILEGTKPAFINRQQKYGY